LLSAKDSLERIKAKQQKFDDKMKAAEILESENSDSSLTAQLKAAGIGSQENSANSVLERIKAKQK
jgi:phage shock protein A